MFKAWLFPKYNLVTHHPSHSAQNHNIAIAKFLAMINSTSTNFSTIKNKNWTILQTLVSIIINPKILTFTNQKPTNFGSFDILIFYG